jgi:hypothetical protein
MQNVEVPHPDHARCAAINRSHLTDSFSAKSLSSMHCKRTAHGNAGSSCCTNLEQRLELLLRHFFIESGTGRSARISTRVPRMHASVCTCARPHIIASVHLSSNCLKLTLNISVRRSSCVSYAARSGHVSRGCSSSSGTPGQRAGISKPKRGILTQGCSCKLPLLMASMMLLV